MDNSNYRNLSVESLLDATRPGGGNAVLSGEIHGIDSSINFLAVNADVARRIDADANLVAVHAEDGEGDIRADHDFFADAARHH